MSQTPQAKYLKDYQAPEFLIPNTELFFTLDDHQTLVRAKLTMQRNGQHQLPLVLDSQVQSVESVKINDQAVAFAVKDETLVVNTTLDDFVIEIESIVDPANNTALEGLYKSAGVFCTQCEAEGFRKITPYLDRPDVLSKFTVTIFTADANNVHVLANGNLIDSGIIAEGDSELETVRWFQWQDPFPKPCYLFALVAGNFDVLRDNFTTQSGRQVALELYVDKGNLHLAPHAMTSLKKSMLWDEQVYGLEYDLDNYMIVAVDFFNMGAMENKGLNVFNSKYVLADEQTATDTDFHGVESVIAHEYFHNWTGNRVTCRDWFQLSLKEGLTVFRDQQFSADMGSAVIERIKHAKIMRTMQFTEDAGPMAHPIRPEKVIEMNNFYTVTVYDKGAEVIRMLHTILGKEGFRKGMDLYFERHDGQAVTCDDFVAAMADANNKDLSQFKHWYAQAGTPVVNVHERYQDGKLSVTLQQSIPTQQGKNKTLLIPVKYQIIDRDTGDSLQQGVLSLEQLEQVFSFDVPETALIVLFEDFSAPVKVERDLSFEQLAHIVKYANDPFSRWDSMQSLWLCAVQDSAFVPSLVAVIRSILTDQSLALDIKAELMAPPSFDAIAESYTVIDVEQILTGLEHAAEQICHVLTADIQAALDNLPTIGNAYSGELVAQRRLKQVLLAYLARHRTREVQALIESTYQAASNMTEKMLSVEAARTFGTELMNQLLQDMDQQFSGNVLVLDKILSSVAQVDSQDVYALMTQWTQHKDFSIKNPNRFRSLYGAFIMRNPAQFHHKTGQGYALLTKLLIELDKINPQVAARMVSPLLSYKRYDDQRQTMMRDSLLTLQQQDLSKDLFEKVNAALDAQ